MPLNNLPEGSIWITDQVHHVPENKTQILIEALEFYERIVKIEKVEHEAGRLATALKYNSDVSGWPEPPFWLVHTRHEFINIAGWTKDLTEYLANPAQEALKKYKGEN